MYTPKYSVILSNVGSCSDRYVSGGYSNPFTTAELFDRVASIDNVEGVELVATWHVTTENVKEIKAQLEDKNLKLVSIIPDHFGTMKWGKGAFSSKDENIRKMAVSHTKDMIDVGRELGCDTISLWPGQDGYDYSFTADYAQERTWFEDGVRECCDYKKDMNISIEYKPKEPRNRSYPSNVSSTLLMVNEINRENCGVTIDYGHAVVAYENVAESVAILKKYGDKLFHMHMNDNYGFWDDDMITGSINTIAYLELLYYLKKTNYNGYLSMDQYPYREDGKRAVEESIKWLIKLNEIVDRMDTNEVESIIHSGDATNATAMIRKYMFGV
ncbi:MAG: sugar phosphate isomerase/epimerase family protein [Oscillospiraceae bacterium]